MTPREQCLKMVDEYKPFFEMVDGLFFTVNLSLVDRDFMSIWGRQFGKLTMQMHTEKGRLITDPELAYQDSYWIDQMNLLNALVAHDRLLVDHLLDAGLLAGVTLLH